ncbi:MAG: hypothetical protein WB565_00105 [Acidimicrobiales bacterium]
MKQKPTTRAFYLKGTKRLRSKADIKGGNVRVQYDLTEGQAVVVTYADWVEFIEHPPGAGFFLPQSFEYLTVRHEIPYTVRLTVGVTQGHSPQVLSLTLSRKQSVEIGPLADDDHPATYPASDSIKSEALREIPVGRLLRDAVLAATHTAPEPGAVPDVMVREKDIAESWRSVVRGELLPRSTSPDYEAVARVYREALTAGERPTRAVADALNVARSTAGRYVMEARARKLLDPAPGPGRSGEAARRPQQRRKRK